MTKKSFCLFLAGCLLCIRLDLSANVGRRIVWDDKIFADVGEISMGNKLDSKTRMDGDEMIHFRLRVISIDDSYIKDSYILAEIEDELFHQTGVLAGMSGSPVYFKGRLLGAVSATQSFLKKPIVIITPIRTMLEAQRYLEGGDRQKTSRGNAHRRILRTTKKYARHSKRGFFSDFFSAWDADWSAFLAGNGPDARSQKKSEIFAQKSNQTGHSLSFFSRQRKTAAIGIGGFSRDFVKSFFHSSAKNVGGLSLVSSAKGGAKSLGLSLGQFEEKANSLEAGDYIGLNLVKGDLNISGYGTVTYVREGLVFAFGHAMSSEGSTHLPLYKAYVNGVMPSLAFSSKIGTLVKEIGVIKQDRFATIVGQLGSERASYIPFEVEYENWGKKEGLFSFEIVDSPYYLGMLTGLAIGSIWHQCISQASVDDMFSMELLIEGEKKTVGHDGEKKDWQISLSKRSFNSGAGFFLSHFPRFILDQIGRNFYDFVTIKKVAVKLKKQFNHFAVVKGVRLAKGNGFFKRGETVDLIVSYQLYKDGEMREKKISYQLPAFLEPGSHRIFISNEQRFMSKVLQNSGITGRESFVDFDSFLKNFDRDLWREDRLVVYTEKFGSALKLPGRNVYRRLPFLVKQRLQKVVSSPNFAVSDFDVHKEDISLSVLLHREQVITIDIIE